MLKNPERYANERRVKYPARSQAIDAGRSPSGAIEEMCRECMCQTDCSSCPDRACWLFPYRPGADAAGATQRTPGIDVPSPEDYAELRRLQDPDGSKAQAMREVFAAARERARGGQASTTPEDVAFDLAESDTTYSATAPRE